MEFSKLVQPIADYFNFLIDFWIYGVMPAEQISAIGEVNTFALGLFLMGIFFNYVVVQLRPFDFDPTAVQTKPTVNKIETHAIFGTVPLLFFSVIMFEFVLWVFAVRNSPEAADMGNFADTLNGHFLLSASLSPVVAVAQLFGDQKKRLDAAGKSLGALNALVAIFGLASLSLIYFAFPLLSFALNVDSSVIRWPYIGSFVFSFVVGLGFGVLIYANRMAMQAD